MGQIKINKKNRKHEPQEQRLTVYDKAIAVGVYIIKFEASVRQTSMVFGISKSRVHELVTSVLPLINMRLALEVKEVLLHNKKTKFTTKNFKHKNAYKTMEKRNKQ